MNVLCLKIRHKHRGVWSPQMAANIETSNMVTTKTMSLQIMPVTEDTPPDMLAGAMDLNVILPNGSIMKMSVERSTPMMDLLVQITTAHKLSPGSHALHAIGDIGILPYKPSTPIGALDTWTVHIVPKNVSKNGRYQSVIKSIPKPFEQTFRLQVHLPRNQLYVARISPKTQLSTILKQVCSEKNLDSAKYTLRKPDKLNESLELTKTLEEYKLQQLTLVLNTNRTLIGSLSSDDIMSRAPKKFSCDDSLSSGSLGERSLSPTRSDGSSDTPRSRSLMIKVLPSRPVRKRRLAPKPPAYHRYSVPEQTLISHSRNSSDSSGYHESSVLSDVVDSNVNLMNKTSNPNLSRSMTNLQACGQNQNQLSAMPFSSNGIGQSKHSASTTSLVSMLGRKKKAAPLPPPLSTVKPKLEPPPEEPEDREQETPRKSQTLPVTSTVTTVESQLQFSEKSKTVSRIELNNNVVEPNLSPTSSSLSSLSRSDLDRDAEPTSPAYLVDSSRFALPKMGPRTKRPAPRPPVRSSSLDIQSDDTSEKQLTSDPLLSVSPLRLPSGCSTGDEDELRMDDDEIDRIFGDATNGYDSPTTLTGASKGSDDIEWEYKLPDPPTAFRDNHRLSPVVTTFGDDVTLCDLSTHTLPEDQSLGTPVVNIDDDEKDVKEDSIRPETSIKTIVRVGDDDYAHSCFLQDSGVGSDDSSLPSSCEEKTIHPDEKVLVTVKTEPVAKKKLNNFKITAYDENCCRPTEIFCDDSVKTWKTTQKAREANPAYKATLVNRRNSLNSTDIRSHQTSGGLVKRSTSHISLLSGNLKPSNRLAKHWTYSTERLDYDDEPLTRRSFSVADITEDVRENGQDEIQMKKPLIEPALEQTSPLHSLQILKTILPQLNEYKPEKCESKINYYNLRLSNATQANAILLDENEKKLTENCQKLEKEKMGSSQIQPKTLESSEKSELKAVDNNIPSQETIVDMLIPPVIPVNQEEEPYKPKLIKYSYAGPPKINLSTWNERPKRQVSIKVDRDYVIGGLRQKFQKTENNQDLPKVSTTLIKEADKKPNVVLSSTSDPSDSSIVSRVPVVKSVELKKPYAEQLHITPALVLSEVIRAQAKLSNGYCGNGIDYTTNQKSNAPIVTKDTKFTTFGELKSSKNFVRSTLKKPQPLLKNSLISNTSKDSRQNLLDAIRTFGGRDNLRKIRA
ncbi:uncharacterized protein LOC126902353 isoform X2 [Daktulosphaira vitifoliae]|uniref:uncharacterized protein LOC126902353 isoform X2 n=1 Tax=Daktulosphaira vitifoliae TaxID=58002 RepID=UPI0021AA3691|nr:uncharacterized protein LOC126902353 isoform X2 [Daktulosphaira vitifoliae]